MGGESGGKRVIGRLYKLGFKGERERGASAERGEQRAEAYELFSKRAEVKIFISHRERSSEGELRVKEREEVVNRARVP